MDKTCIQMLQLCKWLDDRKGKETDRPVYKGREVNQTGGNKQ